MNNSIELLYLLSSTAAVAAMLPQLRQLYITKQSDELSLSTWTTWTLCQGISFVYAVSIGAVAYAVVSVVWVILYIIMACLIVKYRTKQPADLVPAPVTVNEETS